MKSGRMFGETKQSCESSEIVKKSNDRYGRGNINYIRRIFRRNDLYRGSLPIYSVLLSTFCDTFDDINLLLVFMTHTFPVKPKKIRNIYSTRVFNKESVENFFWTDKLTHLDWDPACVLLLTRAKPGSSSQFDWFVAELFAPQRVAKRGPWRPNVPHLSLLSHPLLPGV